MKTKKRAAKDPSDEITACVLQLQEVQERLQELTGGEIDAVLAPGGRSYLLQDAQEKLRQSEAIQRGFAAMQSSILNALPAHIALIDHEGVILSVNESWRSFSEGNGLQGSDSGVGQNYLEICEKAQGNCSEEALQTAIGIRSVLAGTIRDFELEYPCHGPTEQRWFRLMVAPLDKDGATGAAIMHINITERKLEQEKLRQSEEQFRNMFHSAAPGIAVSTPQGRFLQVNASYCQMLGYTQEELLEMNFAALTHPDDLSLNLDLRDELLAGKRESFLMEKRYFKKNGEIVWTRHSVSATHAAGGEIATLMVVAEDITARKRATEELQQRHIELQVLFDLVPAMLCFKDTENIFLRVNQRLAQVTGMPVEQIEGKPAAEIFPQDAAKYYQDDLEVIQTGMPKLGIVEKLHGLENRELWVQTDKVPVCDKDGKVTGIVVMVQDITARKEAEESLALFRALVDQSPDAIEVIDSETGRFLDVNSTGCARLGYSHEEMLSLCVADIDAEKDSGFHWPTIIEEIKKTGFATIISRHRRKDGSTFPVEVNTRYIKLNQGHLVSIVRDITERLQAAKALEELSAKTERRERMLTTALSSMKDFAQIYDKEARFLFANQPLLNLWGLTSQEVVGKSFLELRYPVELAGKLRRQVREVFETRRELIDETHYTSPTGSGAFTNISFRQRSSPMARSISWLEPRAISPSGKGTRRV